MSNIPQNHTENIQSNNFPGLKIGKFSSELPIIQWGMGVGISTHRLAWEVALNGGIGTLSSAGLANISLYKEEYIKAIKDAHTKDPVALTKIFQDQTNKAIKQEIAKAKEISQGKWAIFINVMVAINGFEWQVLAACEWWVDGIVCGAWLPLNLPEITKEYPDIALIPILSNAKGVRVLINRWQKYGKLPDAIILEDPSTAWWHLWARDINAINNPDGILENSVRDVKKYLEEAGYNIPIIAAGGIVDKNDILKMLELWASWVQLGSRFLASEESWANPEFKQAVVDSTEEDIVTYMSSAWLPARALNSSPIFDTMGNVDIHTRVCLKNCLQFCGYRDASPVTAQMCILRELIRSTKPWSWKWLRFVGTSAARIHEILSVKQIMEGFKK